MKPAPFDYLAPSSLAEALAVMDAHGYDAKLLAGGQSLIPVMNFRLAQPALLVDLNRLPELSAVTLTPSGGLRLGSMVRQSQLEHSPVIRDAAPLLFETMPHIAHPQIRNRGTLGGSLAHADPAGELPVICVALDARFRLQRTDGDRWVTASDFFESLFTTTLEPEEILTEVELPPFPKGAGFAFQELARRHGDYAQAGVSAVVELASDGTVARAKLVFLNLGEIPMVATESIEALIGETPSAEIVRHVAHTAAQSEIDPTDDIHASAEYKRHLAAVLGRRVLTQAIERCQTPSETPSS